MYASKLNLLINFAILFQIISSRIFYLIKILPCVIIQMCSNQSNVLNFRKRNTITKLSSFVIENIRFVTKILYNRDFVRLQIFLVATMLSQYCLYSLNFGLFWLDHMAGNGNIGIACFHDIGMLYNFPILHQSMLAGNISQFHCRYFQGKSNI